eukprot:gene21018-15948_t
MPRRSGGQPTKWRDHTGGAVWWYAAAGPRPARGPAYTPDGALDAFEAWLADNGGMIRGIHIVLTQTERGRIAKAARDLDEGEVLLRKWRSGPTGPGRGAAVLSIGGFASHGWGAARGVPLSAREGLAPSLPPLPEPGGARASACSVSTGADPRASRRDDASDGSSVLSVERCVVLSVSAA